LINLRMHHSLLLFIYQKRTSIQVDHLSKNNKD